MVPHLVLNIVNKSLIHSLSQQFYKIVMLDQSTFNIIRSHPCKFTPIALHNVDVAVCTVARTLVQPDLDMERSAWLTPPASPPLLALGIRQCLHVVIVIRCECKLETGGILLWQFFHIEHSEVCKMRANQIIILNSCFVLVQVRTALARDHVQNFLFGLC